MTSKEARALINDELDGYFESPHDDPPTWAVMLTLYLDETLSKEESLWVVAGYLGKKSNWRKYVPAWADALSPKNSIHLADLRLGSRNAKRRHGDMLERLGLVPKQCGLLPFAGSVIVRDYNLDVKDTSLEVIMEGYIMAIIAVMEEVLEFLPRNERVEVVYEEQVEFAQQRARAMKFLNSLPQHRTSRGKPVVASWKSTGKCSLTEVSDYLCYALLQNMINPESPKAMLCAPILNSQKCRHRHRSKEELLRSIENTRKARAAKGKIVLPLDERIKTIIRSGI